MWPYIVLGAIMLFVGMIVAKIVMSNEDEKRKLREENQRLKEGKKNE